MLCAQGIGLLYYYRMEEFKMLVGKKGQQKKSLVKTNELFNMLVGMDIDRAGTRVEENSTINFQTIKRIEDKDGNVSYVEVK